MFCSLLFQEITGVYTDMDQWIELRRKIRNQEVSLRQLQRETGIGRQCTCQAVVGHSLSHIYLEGTRTNSVRNKRYSAFTSGHKLKIIREVLRIIGNNNYFSAT